VGSSKAAPELSVFGGLLANLCSQDADLIHFFISFRRRKDAVGLTLYQVLLAQVFFFLFILFLHLAGLGFEVRAPHLQSKHSTT
jgi:hypothetical protein